MVNSFATSKFCCPALLHCRRLMCVQCRWNSNTTLEWLRVDVWIPRGERLRHSDHCWQDGRSRPPGSTSVFHCPGRRKLRRCVPRYRTYLLPWLDRALILLGLTLCLPSASVSSVFVVLCVYIYTPCPEKNGTNNILGITLTKFNKFSQFLAQFMLTCLLTKKL